MAGRKRSESESPVDIAKLREEVELIELQIRKIEGGVKLSRLRAQRPERKAERDDRRTAREGGK